MARHARCLGALAMVVHLLSACATQPVWHSGFEHGVPGGEWLDYRDGSYAPDGQVPPGRTAAWTIVGREAGEPVFSSGHAYKGWIVGPSEHSHRTYFGIHADIPTPLVSSFTVYLDTDYERLGPRDWIHFGTWGNHDPEAKMGRWALHTTAVRNRKLEFAHTEPFHGEYIGPPPQRDFPLRQWGRFTAYVLYEGKSGLVQVWKDGPPC